MATTRIKEKVSAILSKQFPEFIRQDFTTYIKFLQVYYEFLEQDQGASEIIQNALSYVDIDRTTESFVKYFLANYAQTIPVTATSSKSLIIKKIKDLYESKGSKLSFKLLINLVFSESVDINIPFENVLRPSGGNWQQRNSIRVQKTSGSTSGLVNRRLNYVYQTGLYKTPITEVVDITSNLAEIFLDRNLLAPRYDLGDSVSVEDLDDGGNIIFAGTIQPTTTSLKVVQRGSGFKRGQIYTINSSGGRDTLVKLTNVNVNGEVTNASIINFGYDYPNVNFRVQLDSSDTSRLSKLSIELSDSVQNLDIDGNLHHTANSQVIGTFNSNSRIFAAGNISAPNNLCSILFTSGALAEYPGEFTTSKGFV